MVPWPAHKCFFIASQLLRISHYHIIIAAHAVSIVLAHFFPYNNKCRQMYNSNINWAILTAWCEGFAVENFHSIFLCMNHSYYWTALILATGAFFMKAMSSIFVQAGMIQLHGLRL